MVARRLGSPRGDFSHTMDHIKDWLKTVSRETLSSQADDKPDASRPSRHSVPTVLTPHTIPEFLIPGGVGDSPTRLSSSGDATPENETASPRSHSGHSTRDSSPRGSRLLQESRSAPVSPNRASGRLEMPSGDWQRHRKSVGEITNADPRSLAAMELPHFQAKTSFGFDTLTQAPHTRRKESLFHANPETIGNALSRLQAIQDGAKKETHDSGRHRTAKKSPGSRRNVQIPPVVAPLGVPNQPLPRSPGPSPKNSPRSSIFESVQDSAPPDTMSRLAPPSPTCLMGGPGRGSQRSSNYYRRRSSACDAMLSGSSGIGSRPGSEERPLVRVCSATPSSSKHRHKDSITVPPRHNSASAPCLSQARQRRGSDITVGPDMVKHNGVDAASHNKVEMPPGGKGEVKISVRYLPQSKRLKVELIRAEGLGGKDFDEDGINPFAKLRLLPGKGRKQVSRICKNTTNPVFDQDFYFGDVTLHHVQNMRLRIRFFHKCHNLKRPEFMGELQLNLRDLDLSEENRMWQMLRSKTENEVLLDVYTEFQSMHAFCYLIQLYQYMQIVIYNWLFVYMFGLVSVFYVILQCIYVIMPFWVCISVTFHCFLFFCNHFIDIF